MLYRFTARVYNPAPLSYNGISSARAARTIPPSTLHSHPRTLKTSSPRGEPESFTHRVRGLHYTFLWVSSKSNKCSRKEDIYTECWGHHCIFQRTRLLNPEVTRFRNQHPFGVPEKKRLFFLSDSQRSHTELAAFHIYAWCPNMHSVCLHNNKIRIIIMK